MPKFIDNLVDDTFKLTLDLVYERQIEDSKRLSEYELLFSQRLGVNKRRGFQEGIYPIEAI